MKSMRWVLSLVVVMMVAFASWVWAQDLSDIALPGPRMEGGKPLMQALKDRQSTRAFSSEKLPIQVVADLLWAAHGINRPATAHRTAPSTKGWQEIEIYVVTAEGAWLHDVKAHSLKAVAKGDLRKLTGGQDFVAAAPLNLVYVADTTKMTGSSPEDQALYLGADTGFISQNVYLFCASEGLGTVVRGSVDRKALAEALKLGESKKITLAQTVGYPADEGK